MQFQLATLFTDENAETEVQNTKKAATGQQVASDRHVT